MPIFFILIVSLVIAFNLRLMYINKQDDRAKTLEEYIKEDYSANFSRAHSIDEEMYVRLEDDDFPFRDYNAEDEEELIRIQKKVKQNLSAPIINTGIHSNTEIKKSFGLSNLQTVIYGEENYTQLLHNLNKWAVLLINRGDHDSAELILKKAVDIGSDISETYILLYKLYKETDNKTKIEELKETAHKLPEIAKLRVLNLISEA